jgi:hypothetical protein
MMSMFADCETIISLTAGAVMAARLGMSGLR